MALRALALALLWQGLSPAPARAGPGAAAPAGAPLLLATSEFPPFVHCERDEASGQETARRGIDLEIVAELFRRVGEPHAVRCVPWKRALAMSQSGEVAAAFPGFRTPEREAFAHFLGEPLHRSQYALFVRRGREFAFRALPDLHGKRVGIDRGHDLGPGFDEAVQAGRVQAEEATAPDQNLRKLLAGRLDVYISNHLVVLHVARSLGLEQRIAMLPVPLAAARPSFLMISRAGPLASRPELVERLDEALREMWRDGTVERLTAPRVAGGPRMPSRRWASVAGPSSRRRAARPRWR